MRRVCLVVVLLAASTGLVPAAARGADVFAGHSGWIWGNPLPQGHALRSLEFSGLRGYAAGDFGTLLRTDDGGASWQGVATGFTVDLRRVRVIARTSSSSGAAARCAAPTTAARPSAACRGPRATRGARRLSARSPSRRARPATSPSRTATCCGPSTAAGRGAAAPPCPEPRSPRPRRRSHRATSCS